MKYMNLKSLPKGIAKNLPLKAQEIYMSTYNNAYEDHKDLINCDEISHRIAWTAVKQTFELVNGKWQQVSNTGKALQG